MVLSVLLVGCLGFVFHLVRAGVWCVAVSLVCGRLWAKCGRGKIFSSPTCTIPKVGIY